MVSPDVLVDTSAAVALLVVEHPTHTAVMDEIGHKRLGLSGHAAFETYSVLTRLPGPARRSPALISELMHSNFPASLFLSVAEQRRVLAAMCDLGFSGGAVYDALVAFVSKVNDMPLVTCDQRAAPTYRAVQASVVMIRPKVNRLSRSDPE